MNTSITKIFITQSLILLSFVCGCALATDALSKHLTPKTITSWQGVNSPVSNVQISPV
jgi:hypothetical protein